MVERAQVSKGAATVFVACKLPNGFWLQRYHMVDQPQTTAQGTKMVPTAVKKGEPILIKGCALKFGQVSETPMPGGYALTQVPADVWNEWLDANKETDMVLNRLVFAHDSMDKSSDQAREQAAQKVRSGMEPIDPKKPPPVGMKVTPAEKVA